VATEEGLTGRGRRVQVCLARRDDAQVGCQHQVQAGHGLEQRAEIRLRKITRIE
jgi:hypothetical protein